MNLLYLTVYPTRYRKKRSLVHPGFSNAAAGDIKHSRLCSITINNSNPTMNLRYFQCMKFINNYYEQVGCFRVLCWCGCFFNKFGFTKPPNVRAAVQLQLSTLPSLLHLHSQLCCASDELHWLLIGNQCNYFCIYFWASLKLIAGTLCLTVACSLSPACFRVFGLLGLWTLPVSVGIILSPW